MGQVLHKVPTLPTREMTRGIERDELVVELGEVGHGLERVHAQGQE